jgi:hypothetical protein
VKRYRNDRSYVIYYPAARVLDAAIRALGLAGEPPKGGVTGGVNALRTFLLAACAGFAIELALVGAAAAQTPSPPPAPSAAPSGLPAPPAGAAAPSGTSPFASLFGNLGGGAAPQPYASFVKGVERESGLIDILHKDDDVYLDLSADQLGKPFIFAPVLASGVGGSAFAGRIYPSFVISFQRVGKRILWVSQNTGFSAPPGTSFANALAISTTDSVINASPIVAQDEGKKRIVISAGFFLTDYENLARDLGGSGAPAGGGALISLGLPRAGFTLDATRSSIEKTKALPKNDEFLIDLVFVGPPNGPATATDGRGVRLRMHYSILEAPPAGNYVPRLADDRVGYFITAHKSFDDDAAASPFVRYIDRWNFANGPIVYYLTNEIPPNYKAPIRAALLEWNKAFAKAGIPNAIEVRDQPADPGWDPDDIRYSTVRWLTSDRPAFSAYGPHIEDPRTGEIIRVEIVIDGEAVRSVKRGYVDQVVPTRHPDAAALGSNRTATLVEELTGPAAAPAPDCDELSACDGFMHDSAELAAVGTLALRAGGAASPATEKYTEDWLYSVVLHEAGHNFGLRHNFAAAIYPLDKLHDRNFTERNGLVSSVMHYTPLNLSPPGRPQGDYFQMHLGPYDEWAIRYGYAKYPGVTKPADESAQLRRLAEESTRPDYAYATDEDASGPRGIDPHVAAFLLSSDPFAFYRNQFDVVDDLVAKLDKVYPRDDVPYSEERNAFLSMMRQYQRAAMLATRYVGGLYVSRAHRGQPGGTPPFRPVARDDQRRAFATLAEHVFSSRAMRFSPALLADLGPDNYLHRGSEEIFGERPDFPVAEYVETLQTSVMFEVMSPATLTRIADEQLKVAHPQQAMSVGDLFGWMQAAVWDDLHPGLGSIDVLQRNLQRRYTNYEIALALAPSFLLEAIGFPGDTAPVARFELRRLNERLKATLRSPHLDLTTRAHLEDIHSRVRATLEPTTLRDV